MRIGFIGTGNMGGAIIKGYINKDAKAASRIFAFDVDAKKIDALVQELKISGCKSSEELVKSCDAIMLSIKPNICGKVLEEIKDFVTDRHILVSMVAGYSIGAIEESIGRPVKVIRILPNMPAMVNESMTAVCRNKAVTDQEFSEFNEIIASIGLVEVVEEKLIEAVVGVSSSSPAYIYMFIEALADGAVLLGMPRHQAYKFASQALIGSARMVLETGIHPGELKDMVCSPGGTTIEGVRALEKNGFRSSVIEAVVAAAEKSRKVGK
jgi:pyrroline-5-carboxylate reductase